MRRSGWLRVNFGHLRLMSLNVHLNGKYASAFTFFPYQNVAAAPGYPSGDITLNVGGRY